MSWDRVERLIGKENLQRLAGKKVGVVGLGSGGAFVALSLAMSGVGHFVLIDDEPVEDSNLVRHIADRRYLGTPKVDAVADLIKQRNPDAAIDARVGRLSATSHADALDDLDLLVVGVDGENAKFIINELCLKRDLTAIYAGVYERGEGGDSNIIRPWDGPCYACWAETLRDGMAISKGPTGELDYGMIGPEGTLEAEPGLWLHVVKVASVQADLALNELMEGTDRYVAMPGNTIIMANRAIEIEEGVISPPHTALWVNIERDPNCLVCGDAVRASRALKQETGVESTMSLDDLGVEQRDGE
jgi:molybdopterin/thiamine biosynthesis adenylyltransferase